MSGISQTQARYETALGTASRALWKAANAAAQLGAEGAYEDLQAAHRHISAMLEQALVRGKGAPRVIQGQTQIPLGRTSG
jgi:hypothetical protein